MDIAYWDKIRAGIGNEDTPLEQLNVKIPTSLREDLECEARRRGVTISAYTRAALAKALKR